MIRALCFGLAMAFLPFPHGGAGAAPAGARKPPEEAPAVFEPSRRLGLFLFGRAEAPEFALRELSGEEVRLSEYRGKVVLLNFWTTY